MTQIDKILFVNRTALAVKYNSADLKNIEAALLRLVAADKGRGITDRIIAIDDATDMQSVGGLAVVGAADQRGAKAAIDAAFARSTPGYGVLIDGPDVIPHIVLNAIPGLQNDTDTSISSDLPYASPSGWSRQASSYLAITRAIGRLPAATGTKSGEDLIKIIDNAACHLPLPLNDFRTPFALSAEVWLQSTQLSIATTFGAGHAVQASPIACHTAIDGQLKASNIHFINCHGAVADPNFYGQTGLVYPVAMSSLGIASHVPSGAVVAAECCFGADLYDFGLAEVDQPICMSYLRNGACAFVGSTCIAYGERTTNVAADLLTQYFLQNVLTGKSSGHAFLEAQQQFVRTQVMAGPANLKTVAQFVLLGDPSCIPCKIEETTAVEATAALSAKAMAFNASAAEIVDEGAIRAAAIGAQHAAGIAAASAASRPGREITDARDLERKIRNLAKDRNLRVDTLHILDTSGGAHYRSATAKFQDTERQVAVAVEKHNPQEGHVAIKLMISYIIGGKIAKVEMLESR